MTDKIKSAREWHKDGTLLYTLKQAGWEKGIEQFQNATTIKVDGDNAEAVAETILEALSALEKLQGVDLEGLVEAIKYMREDGQDKEAPYAITFGDKMDALLKSAQLVADIGKDGRWHTLKAFGYIAIILKIKN